MPRGGSRPGAGRPKKPRRHKRAAGTPVQLSPAEHALLVALRQGNESPADIMSRLVAEEHARQGEE